ncbi:MAG: outer membrane lipoprotein-sorting protein [Magnetococcus sp. DMHC-6]
MPKFMLSIFLSVGMLILSTSDPLLSAATAAEPAAQELLEKADRYRLPSLDNLLQVVLFSWKGEEQVGEAHYTVWTKGTDRSRVEMQDPKVRGQRVLMTEEGMWLFIPTTRRAIRITPMQRLLGEASYGDIGRMVWRDDYTAEFATDKKQGTVNGLPAWQLLLTARKSAAVYARIDLSLTVADERPLTADFYLASGKKFKSAIFDPPQMVLNQPIITKIRFADEGDKERHTVLELHEITQKEMPDSFFTQSGLSRD